MNAIAKCIETIEIENLSVNEHPNAIENPRIENLSVEVAHMAAFDYIFLTSDQSNQSISDQQSLTMALRLIEELSLTPERSTFIAIDTDHDNHCTYSQHELQWLDHTPIELKRTPIINPKHIHFIETIRQHSYQAIASNH